MINTVGEINDAAKNPQRLIENAENKYLNDIFTVSSKIANDDNIKIVALAGPSASGKTTTAHIMENNLARLGENTVVVSLDDFYLSGDKLPILANGRRDTESVNSLNIPLIRKCFSEIIEKGYTRLPEYNFANSESVLNSRLADISNGGIIIVEGLHALNPLITDLVPRKNIFKLYISANCSIGDNFGEQLLSSRQIRLVRRMLRDRIFRGTSAEQTLEFWNGVVAGERQYLYCFKNTADVLIKTLHIYEPCVYKKMFTEIKNEVSPDCVCYDYFMRTVSAIERFDSIDAELVPCDSLIREFIGNDPKAVCHILK